MTSISEWAVLQIASGERYLIGVDAASQVPIVSAPLQSFVPAERTFRAADGRTYKAVNLGLVSVKARRAWRHWCYVRVCPGFIEVTEEYEESILTATKPNPSAQGEQ